MDFSQSIRKTLRRWMQHALPACRDIAPVISQSLDRRLPPHRRLISRLHLFVCTRCVRYLRQLRLLRTVVRARAASTFDEESAELSLSPEARQRIVRALQAD